MQAAEYVARYNNGQTVPFTTYNWGSGQNCAPNSQTVVATGGRGEDRPIWEMIYNHYARRRSLSVPNIAAAAAELRPEGGPGGHATTFDQPGFGSLTYTLDAATTAPITNGTYKIAARHSGKAMEVADNGTANGANVRQWTSNTCACQQWTVTNTGSNQYSIVGVGSGKNLDVASNSTADGANIHIWQSTGGNNQRFIFTPTSGGYYRITAVHSGKAIGVIDAATADGANIRQWAANTCQCQEWSLTPISSAAARVASEETGPDEAGVATEELTEAAVYPNPAMNEVTITSPESYRQGEKVASLQNEHGNTVVMERFAGTTHRMNISGLPQGLYVLRVNAGGSVSVRKVIKK